MQPLVTAILIAAIVVLIALVAAMRFFRSRQPQKGHFIKTSRMGTSKAPTVDSTAIQKDLTDSDIAPQTDDSSGATVQTELLSAQKKTPMAPSTETQKIQTHPVQTPLESKVARQEAQSSITAKEPAPSSMVTAQLNAELSEAEPELTQTAAELVEAESEPSPMEAPPTAETTPAKFITEIESDPIQIDSKQSQKESRQSKKVSSTPSDRTVTRETAPSKSKKKSAKSKTSAQASSAKKASKKLTSQKNEEKAAAEEIKAKVAESANKKSVTLELDSAAEHKQPVAEQVQPVSFDTDRQSQEQDRPPKVNVTPSEQPVDIAETLASGTLDDWIALINSPLSPENLQAVIHKIALTTYPRRKDSKMRSIFLTHARKYVDTFKDNPPQNAISEYIYRSLAIVMQEDKMFEEAIDLCRAAIKSGLDDGTKTGYAGRIERLKKSWKSKSN